MNRETLGCLVAITVLFTVTFYVVAFRVAEYFGVNGWVGVAIAFLATMIFGGKRSRS